MPHRVQVSVALCAVGMLLKHTAAWPASKYNSWEGRATDSGAVGHHFTFSLGDLSSDDSLGSVVQHCMAARVISLLLNA